MPKNILAEMGSQVGLTASRQNRKEASAVVRGPMVNPSFEPDDVLPKNFSPVQEEKAPKDKTIFMVNLREKPVEEEEEEYEPYDNRVVDKPTSNKATWLHLLKGSLGTGILAMAHAFKNAGYVIGTIGTFIIGVLCTYCIHMLVDSSYVLCKRRKIPSMSYPSLAEAALSEGPDWCKAMAPYARHVVNVFLLVYQIGTSCVYVVFVTENIHFFLAEHWGFGITKFQIMLCILPALIMINWVRNLKYMAPLSLIANIVTVVSFAIILYYIFREPPSFEDRDAVGELAKFPLFFGTVLFALEAVGVILPLENQMKHPKDFVARTGVLNQGMSIIIFLYIGMGLSGYLKYGKLAAGSITLNLPAKTDILASVVQGLLAFAIFITHGLSCYVAIDLVNQEYLGSYLANSKYRLLWDYLLRTSIVLITFAIAAAVPELDLFISLFGALCLSALGLAFPAFIQICTYWNYVSRAEKIRMVIKNAIVMLFGLLGLIVGTWTSLEAIVVKFSGEHGNATASVTESVLNYTLTY